MAFISKLKLPDNSIQQIKDASALHSEDLNAIDLSSYEVESTIPQAIIDKINDSSVVKYGTDYYALQSRPSGGFAFTSAISSDENVQGKRLVISHSEGVYTLTSLETIESGSGSGGEVINLTSYSDDDPIDTDVALKLADPGNIVQYNNDYYRLSKCYTDTSSGAEIKLFISINNFDGGNGLFVKCESGSSEWIFGGIVGVAWARYNEDNQLVININNDDSSFLVQDGTQTIRLYKNVSQSADNVTLQFPHNSGTLALLSDISAAQDPTYAQVINALGFIPYDSVNPSHYISTVTFNHVVNALGYTPYDSSNPNGFLTSITKSNVTNALGYTPYNATNPNSYISGISSTDVVGALGYTPYSSDNPDNYINKKIILWHKKLLQII